MRRRRSSSHDAATYAPRDIRDYYGPFTAPHPPAAPPPTSQNTHQHPIARDRYGSRPRDERDERRRWAPSYDRGYSTAASRAHEGAERDTRYYRPDERRSWSARGYHHDHRYAPPPPSAPDRPRDRERWPGPRDDFRDAPAPDRRFHTRDYDNDNDNEAAPDNAAGDADAWDRGRARTHAHAWPPRRPPLSASSDPHGLITPFANSGRGPARPHPSPSSSRPSRPPSPFAVPALPTGPRPARYPQDQQHQVPPTPSADYLALAAAPSTALPDPPPPTARKLLVLDLNGTLLLRSARAPWSARASASAHAKPAPRTVHPRAYLPAFRAYLFAPRTRAWLDVVVWSSAQPHNVEDMVSRAFAGDRAKLGAVWARDTMGLAPDRYFRKVQTLKDLNKLWTELPARPARPVLPPDADAPAPTAPAPVRHSAHSTLLLDDSHKKAALQPHNHVCVPEYTQALRNRDLEALRAERAARAAVGAAAAGASGSRAARARAAGASGAALDAGAEPAPAPAPAAPPTTPRAVAGVADAMGDEREAGGEDEDKDDKDDEEDVLGSHKRKRRSTKQKRAEKAARERERAAASTSASASTSTKAKANPGMAVDAGASAAIIAAAGDAGADGLAVQPPPAPPPAFDETLLAVVGILHAARTQSSVAGWIRGGALWGGQAVDAVDAVGAVGAAKAAEAGESDGSVEEGGRGKRRRRRGAAEGEEDEEEGGKEEGGVKSAGAGAGEDTVPAPVPVWFEHAPAVGYWAARGRAALEALGIPVEHGIER